MDAKTKNNLRHHYYEYQDNLNDLLSQKAALEDSKRYILTELYTIKATVITDMPTTHNPTDLSSKIIAHAGEQLDEINEIDSMILSIIMQVQRLMREHTRLKNLIDKLTEDEKKVLEGRVYNLNIVLLSDRVRVCDRHIVRISRRISEKLGI